LDGALGSIGLKILERIIRQPPLPRYLSSHTTVKGVRKMYHQGGEKVYQQGGTDARRLPEVEIDG
jgi:hypothetical protein